MAALGRPGYINLGHADDMPGERGVDEMRAHAHAVLDAAYELVCAISTARAYGLSEDFVASWLATRPDADAAICGSKWGYEYTANWRVQVGEGEAHEVKFHTPEQFEKQVAESRALLPSMAVYQIHSATEASGVLDNEAVLARLAALRDGGVVAGRRCRTRRCRRLQRRRRCATPAARRYSACGDLQPARPVGGRRAAPR